MNTRLLGFVLFLCAGLLHAQVVDLKKFWLSRRGPEEAAIKLKDGMYLKDQSGLLPPFIGTWAGVYRDYGYIVSINKHVFRGTYTKFTAGLLYFTYEVYKKNEVGDWYIVEASYDSQGRPPFLRSAYYLEPQSYHTIYRGKNSDKRYGFVIFSLCPDESLRFYVMNDPTFDDIKEEEQVFPYWHKEAGITNFSHLYRVGEAGEMPVGRMQFYDKSLDALGFWQPMQRMLHSSRFLLEGKSYVPFLSAGFTNKLRYTTGDDLLDMDPFTSAPHPRLTPSGIRFRDQDWHTGEFSYELYYSSFLQPRENLEMSWYMHITSSNLYMRLCLNTWFRNF